MILGWLVYNISFFSVFSRTRENFINSSVGSLISRQLSKAKYFTVRYKRVLYFTVMSSWQQRLYEASCCGCCIRRISEAELRSRKIDRQIAEDAVRYCEQMNVLLLGTPGSGKRTLLTEVNILYGKDYDNDELNEFSPIVYGEIFKGMKVLADARRKLRLEWQNPSNQQHEEKILNFQLPQHIDTEKFMSNFESIKNLWLDKAIQDAFDGRDEFQLVRMCIYKILLTGTGETNRQPKK